MNKILGLLLVLMVSISTITAQDKLSKKEKRQLEKLEEFEKLQDLISNKKLEFIADRAFPTGYRNVDLTTNPNFLRISNDSAHAEMPYFGRAFSATPGERGGIRFESEMIEKSIEINEKKMKVTLIFEIKDDGKNYRCILDMFGGGSASLSVGSDHLQQISYNGNIEEYTPEEEK
ncbi:DUF4251 domain-containing protein [Saccharicrinis aurantiacus]|uniref:DUF4251 domain-containing protein n=1 Tax=Saccharicrinis aurantiacus TaxID=1849719 RepID=UPI00095009BA|nr:DUF4251 domain-containing protein [Saccharicrinis aurantiacus]